MLTLEQAQSLKPGDKVVSLNQVSNSPFYVEFEIVPNTGEYADDSIVQYLVSTGHKLPSFIFTSNLHRFSIVKGK